VTPRSVMTASRRPRRQRVLRDHTQKGKQFLPPFLSMKVPMTAIDWVGEFVPDFLWLGLLIHKFGPNTGLGLATELAKRTLKNRPGTKKRIYSFSSAYERISIRAAEKVRGELAAEGYLDHLREGLYPLFSLYPTTPLAFLFEGPGMEDPQMSVDESLGVLKYVTGQLIERTTRLSAITQTAAVAILASTGKLHVQPDSPMANLEAILDYPDNEESQILASCVRASVNGLGGPMSGDVMARTKWPERFWRQGYQVSVCDISSRHEVDDDANSDKDVGDGRGSLTEILAEYRRHLTEEVTGYWSSSTPNLALPQKGEVLAGLLAREARLVCAMASDTFLWTPDIGEIVLRSQVEAHVNLTWLIRCGKAKDFASFVEYGLGQEKLAVEHLYARVQEKGTGVPGGEEHVRERLRVVNNEIFSAFLPVNVGDWINKSVRERAQEAGLDDDYNLLYLPASSVAHSAWNSLTQQNLRRCANPLHRFHRMPVIRDFPAIPELFMRAVELMDESLEVWAGDLGVQRKTPTAADRLSDVLESWQTGNRDQSSQEVSG
jgi:Family of unknown function (DUF5677)